MMPGTNKSQWSPSRSEISKQWQHAIENHSGYEKTWSVYALGSRTL